VPLEAVKSAAIAEQQRSPIGLSSRKYRSLLAIMGLMVRRLTLPVERARDAC
jgi:hypothetical protein